MPLARTPLWCTGRKQRENNAHEKVRGRRKDKTREREGNEGTRKKKEDRHVKKMEVNRGTPKRNEGGKYNGLCVTRSHVDPCRDGVY